MKKGVYAGFETKLIADEGEALKAVPRKRRAEVRKGMDALASGATVELVVYDGEGHSWKRPETTIDELGRIDAFLARFCP